MLRKIYYSRQAPQKQRWDVVVGPTTVTVLKLLKLKYWTEVGPMSDVLPTTPTITQRLIERSLGKYNYLSEARTTWIFARYTLLSWPWHLTQKVTGIKLNVLYRYYVVGHPLEFYLTDEIAYRFPAIKIPYRVVFYFEIKTFWDKISMHVVSLLI